MASSVPGKIGIFAHWLTPILIHTISEVRTQSGKLFWAKGHIWFEVLQEASPPPGGWPKILFDGVFKYVVQYG